MVALALIPEAIAFSIIVGVDPKVGLYASFSIATLLAFVGGRPGMISAATGAMALVMVSLVKSHGLDYLLAATVLTGVFQVLAGWVRLDTLMQFVSRSVLTGVSIALGLEIRTVGDMGELPESLPAFLIPNVPFNLATGFIGGMAGCAMIGQSVINVKSGGRGRLSTLVAGVVLLILVVFLGDWVKQIPMAALVAVMVMVSIGTFNWGSIRNLREHPKSSSVVMIATVVVTVATHDLAKGVLTGVLLSGFSFAQKVGKILHMRSQSGDEGRSRTYLVAGQVFFASADRFANAFDYKEVLDKVCIDVSRAHFWDITAISALDKVVLKFRREGTEVEVLGLNAASATLVDKFAVHDKDGADDVLLGH